MDSLSNLFQDYLTKQASKDIPGMLSLFPKLAEARNKLAFDKGFQNYPDMLIQKKLRIPADHWGKYLATRDSFATQYHPHLSDIKSQPHFLSQIPPLNITFPDDVYTLSAKDYPKIKELRSKIAIVDTDPIANFQYNQEKDSYRLNIPQTHPHQQISFLIHELSHVITQENLRHQIDSLYLSEYEAHQIEFKIAKSISESFFKATVQEYLICFVRVDFQIEIFNHPETNPITVYSQCFSKYLGQQNSANPTDFLFDTKIINKPLLDLPDAVSIVNLIHI